MAQEMPVDLRTWRKGDESGCQGRGVITSAREGQSPKDRVSFGTGTPPTPWHGPSGEPRNTESSPCQPGLGHLHAGAQSPGSPEEEKKADTSLPLRKRRYAMRGAEGDTSGPPPGKVPKTEIGEEKGEPLGNGYYPPFVTLSYPRVPAVYYQGLTSSLLSPEMHPIFYPMAPHPLLGVPTPSSLISSLEAQLAADIATATKQDEDGDTPLHIAVAQGNLPVARRLVLLFLQGRHDLDTFNNLRQTPLHLAVITAQPVLVKLLLVHGSSPMVLDRHGQTALHLACEHGSPQCLRELLDGSSTPLELEARNYEGLTPLHVAVSTSNHATVLSLLEHGADIDAVDIKSGRSPLLHTVENNNLAMVELLLQRGASVNAQSYGGNTALHAASGRGLLEAVRLLVRSGADGALKNYHNDTPLMVAKNKRVIDILRGKASRVPPPPDSIREGSSPATSTASSPGIQPTPNGLCCASPPATPSPVRTPNPHRAALSPVSANQRPEDPEPANRVSTPGPLCGVKLERNQASPTLVQPMGFTGTPKLFLPLAEGLLDPSFCGAIYPFAASGQEPGASRLSLLPVGYHRPVVSLTPGLLANHIHPRDTGMDQSWNPPSGLEGQQLHSKDSGAGGS